MRWLDVTQKVAGTHHPLGCHGDTLGLLVSARGGVSGGTVALVVGIYDELINSAGHVVSAGKRALLGPDRAAGVRHHLGRVHWRIVVPVVIGMVAALLTVAGPMSHLVEEYPVTMRALFFGMVLASIGVPLRLAGGALRARDAAVMALAAVLAFVLVSVPPTTVAPAPLLIDRIA